MSETATAKGELGAMRWDDGRPAARFERRFATDAHDLWAAMTDPKRIGRWMAPVEVHGEPATGTRYSIDFGEGGITQGAITTCDAPQRFEVTWEHDDEPPSSVLVEIRADGDGAVLVLDHRRLPLNQAHGYTAGWHAHLDRLDADLSGTEQPDWDTRWSELLWQYRAAGPKGEDGTTGVPPDVVTTGVQPSGHLLGSAEQPVVVLERELGATPAEVWDAWTKPERLVRWLGAVEGSLDRPGVPVRVAMTADELPSDLDEAGLLATFTVQEASPPEGERAGRLTFTFDDEADPGGTVTVLLSAVGADRCRIVLRHALKPLDTAITQAPGFGAGWEGFLDWLDAAVSGHERGEDPYEALLPSYEGLGRRLSLVHRGAILDVDGQLGVSHERLVSAAPQAIWDVLTSSENLSAWLGPVQSGGLAGPGSTVDVLMDGRPDDPAAEHVVCTVTCWNPPERLTLDWDYTGEPTSRLEVTLAPEGESTLLVLQEWGVEKVDDYLAGWHAHLDLLVAMAESRPRPPWDQAFAAARSLVG